MLEEELRPCFHDTHSPILEFVHAYLPQNEAFFFKKKLPLLRKRPSTASDVEADFQFLPKTTQSVK